MIVAIEAGREGSKGFPGKNSYCLNGYPMMAYPLMAAVNCDLVDIVCFTSDSNELNKIAKSYGVNYNLSRPKELSTDQSLLEDVYVWAYKRIKIFCPDYIVLLMANAVGINSKMLTEMILELRENEEADSICTVSKYNMFHPCRSRKLEKQIIYHDVKVDSKIIETDDKIEINIDGEIFGKINQNYYFVSYVPEVFDEKTSCDRDCNEDNWIYDCSCAVVRPYCLENIKDGLPPQRWLGRKILGYKQETPAIDVDFVWQLGQVKYWLEKHWDKQ